MSYFIKTLKFFIFGFMFLCLLSCDAFFFDDNTSKYNIDLILDKNEPVNISIWHYYNSKQKEMFDKLIDEFNASVGLKYGVSVKGIRRAGNASEIASFLSETLSKNSNTDEIPDIFSAYPDTAYEFNRQNLLLDLSDFFTEKEKDEYVKNFLYSSGFGVDDEIKLFPVAKATEVLVINKTAWQPFAEAMGVSHKDLLTWEGLVQVGELYYRWTDSFTLEPNDGKTFFGRDALSNYILTGTYELGNNIFNVSKTGDVEFKLDKKALRICWDNYYIPFVKGFFGAKGRFRSDDLKTGDIIACVTSTSSATYLPLKVIDSSGNFQVIELDVLPVPHFRKAKKKAAVQQGAGMAVLKSNLQREAASVLFLKWLTDRQRFPEFDLSTGYLPVKKKELEKVLLQPAASDKNAMTVEPVVHKALRVSIETMRNLELYFQPGFKNADKARRLLSDLLEDKAKTDRAKVLENVKNGKNYMAEIKGLLGDAAFEIWFEELEKNLFDLK